MVIVKKTYKYPIYYSKNQKIILSYLIKKFTDKFFRSFRQVAYRNILRLSNRRDVEFRGMV